MKPALKEAADFTSSLRQREEMQHERENKHLQIRTKKHARTHANKQTRKNENEGGQKMKPNRCVESLNHNVQNKNSSHWKSDRVKGYAIIETKKQVAN